MSSSSHEATIDQSAMSSSMHEAINSDDIDTLRDLLESGADVNLKFSEHVSSIHAEMTPLALATARDSLEAVKLLIYYGANIDETFGSLDTTVLMTSSFHGYNEIVELLLEEGANFKLVDNQGSTALGYAFGGSRSLDVIDYLLKAGVDVNQPNLYGMTSLLLVAGYGNDQLVQMVLDAGANADSTNKFGNTALHLAVVGKLTLLKRLSSQNDSIDSDMNWCSLNRRDIDVALNEWIREHNDVIRRRSAACEGELRQVGRFMVMIGNTLDTLDNSDDVDESEQNAMKRRIGAVWKYRQDKMQWEKNKHKKTAFDNLLACGGKQGHQAMNLQDVTTTHSPMSQRSNVATSREVHCINSKVKDIANKYSNILCLLIDAGCRIDKMEDTFGLTALDMAILLGDIESTATLVAAGGDHKHLMKMFASSELFDAIVNVDKKQMKRLLAYDVDLDVNQPFCRLSESKKLFTEDVHLYKYEGLTPLTLASQVSCVDVLDIIRLLRKRGADVNKVGPGGSSPLAEATRVGNLKMVQFLVKEGADVELGNPAYDDAAAIGIAVTEKRLDIIDFLITHGAKVDKVLSNGQNLLMKAVDTGVELVLEKLLKAKLETNFSDPHNSVYEFAEKYQKKQITVKKIMSNLCTAAEQNSVASLCGLGGVSSDALLSLIPDLASLTTTTPAVKQEAVVNESRIRKKRWRKQNSSRATIDSSYQSAAVALSLTNAALQDTLNISGISFKSFADNLDDNGGTCNETAGHNRSHLWPHSMIGGQLAADMNNTSNQDVVGTRACTIASQRSSKKTKQKLATIRSLDASNESYYNNGNQRLGYGDQAMDGE